MIGSGHPGVKFAPRVPSWSVHRGRLTARITAAVADGLVILRAGAGGGKTALLADWARTVEMPGVWVTVRAETGNRYSLWEHVLGSIDDDRARAALAGIGGRSEASLRAALREAFNDEPRLIILDDYHLIADDDVHDDIIWLLQSTGCSVVIATRTVGPLESPLVAARMGPTVIEWAELAFTVDETAAVLAGDRDVAAEAHDRLAGWPLGTRMLSLELARRGGQLDLDTALETVVGFIAPDQTVRPPSLNAPHALEFAVRATVADGLTLDLARELAPQADAHQLLEAFEADGVGAWGEEGDGAVFRFQPFALTALSTLAARSGADLAYARRVVARWADDHDHAVLAGRQAAALKDWALLAEITQRHFRRIMRVHKPEWAAILSGVPLEQLRRRPVLATTLLQLLNAESAPTDRIRALAMLLMSSVAPLRERGTHLDRLWRNAAVLSAERITGRYPAALATAERISRLIDGLTSDEYHAVEDLLPLMHVQIGTTRLYMGDADGAVPSLQESVRLSSDAPWSWLHATSMLALVAALRGDMVSAGVHADAVEQRAVPGWRGTYSAAGYHLARAAQRLESFDTAGAETEVAQLDRHFATIEHWPLMLHLRARISLLEGSADAAAGRVSAEARVRSRRTSTSPAMRSLLTASTADLLISAGRVASAERVLARADDGMSPAVWAANARAALVSRDDRRALALSTRLIDTEGLPPRLLGMALLVRALELHDVGDMAGTNRDLHQALQLLDSHGLRTPLALLPRDRLESALAALGRWNGAPATAVLDGVPAVINQTAPTVQLSKRELVVLRELARTASLKDVADALYVSPNTVKTQARAVYRKLGASTRDEALRAAVANGLLPHDEY